MFVSVIMYCSVYVVYNMIFAYLLRNKLCMPNTKKKYMIENSPCHKFASSSMTK